MLLEGLDLLVVAVLPRTQSLLEARNIKLPIDHRSPDSIQFLAGRLSLPAEFWVI